MFHLPGFLGRRRLRLRGTRNTDDCAVRDSRPPAGQGGGDAVGPCSTRQQTTGLHYLPPLVGQLLPCYMLSPLGAVTVAASKKPFEVYSMGAPVWLRRLRVSLLLLALVVGLSPASGSGLSVEPAWVPLSLSLSLSPLPLTLSLAHALIHTYIHRKYKNKK